MEPTARGRYCRRCEREVLDLTDPSSAGHLVERAAREHARDGVACVRLRCGQCPSRPPRGVTAWAAVASTLLVACVHEGRSVPTFARPDPDRNSGCPSASFDPWAPEGATRWEPQHVCTVMPDAPQCKMRENAALILVPHSRAEASIPAHLRADCDETRDAMGDWAIQGAVVVEEVHSDGEEHPPAPGGQTDSTSWLRRLPSTGSTGTPRAARPSA